MALSRRTGQRFQASIWPGFVDAMTGLLLVLMFVLTIFMMVQFVLRETISGQESELDDLAGEVGALAAALGLEERKSTGLETRLGALNTTLSSTRSELNARNRALAELTAQQDLTASELEIAQSRISGFEAQVAALISSRDDAERQVSTLTAERADQDAREVELLSQQDRLNLALATARGEIDAQTEAARLDAAKREALQALVADLEREGSERAKDLATRNSEIAELNTQLSDEEAARLEEQAARLAEAAAAKALQERLQNADAELTAMTLSLEAERKAAEDTLTLLAAAQAAEKTLSGDLSEALERLRSAEAAALDDTDVQAALLAQANAALANEEAVSAEAQREAALLNQQVAALRGQLGGLQALLDDFKDRDAAQSIQLQSLGQDLNTALARAASEERKRRLLEEEERKRAEDEAEALALKAEALEAESEDLARYRSEFFGRLRDLLGNQDGVRIQGDRFVFASEVLFDPGSADLSEAGRAEVAKVAGILQSVAAAIPSELNWVIRVDGHTDNDPLINHPKFEDNWELSQGRALSVVRYMVENLGLPPERLSANGFGEFQPVDPRDTAEARAQNRRIELKFTER